MKKLMLIGGGEVGRGNTSYETELIDKEIVKMTEKEKPNFLFVGLASSFSDSYYDTMKKIYKDLGCEVSYLKKKNIINNMDIVKNKIETADIIYFCGGDTVKLINDIKSFQIDSLLKEALERGTVLAGVSAGAILLGKGGYSDALILRGESEDYTYIEGLGFTEVSVCPHYKENPDKTSAMIKFLKESSTDIYALENCTALKIVGDKYEVVKSKKTKNAYYCKYRDDFKEEIITTGSIK